MTDGDAPCAVTYRFYFKQSVFSAPCICLYFIIEQMSISRGLRKSSINGSAFESLLYDEELLEKRALFTAD